jgi:hypothetical protein
MPPAVHEVLQNDDGRTSLGGTTADDGTVVSFRVTPGTTLTIVVQAE